jgi:hypothetical protein
MNSTGFLFFFTCCSLFGSLVNSAAIGAGVSNPKTSTSASTDPSVAIKQLMAQMGKALAGDSADSQEPLKQVAENAIRHFLDNGTKNSKIPIDSEQLDKFAEALKGKGSDDLLKLKDLFSEDLVTKMMTGDLSGDADKIYKSISSSLGLTETQTDEIKDKMNEMLKSNDFLFNGEL